MKKMLFGIWLFCLLFSFQSIFGQSQTCGTNVAYTVAGNSTDGMTISFMKADPAADAVWGSDCTAVFDNNTFIKNVVIAEPIRLIDGRLLFSECESVESMDLAKLDVSNVTDMSFMFNRCFSLQALDLSGWDFSNVTNMESMFYQCYKLDGRAFENLNIGRWNVSNVTNMKGMFGQCQKLDALNIRDWNVSNVTNMEGMFSDCKKLESLDLSGWNVSNVMNMEGMFDNCNALKSLYVSGWNTSNLRSMIYLFSGCSALENVDVSGWNTSGVNAFYGIFNNCSSLKNLDLSQWDTSNACGSYLMFNGCTSLEELNLSGWDTSGFVLNDNTFSRCDALHTLTLGRKTVETNIFMTLPVYNDTWNYVSRGTDVSTPLPLKTKKNGEELFANYDYSTMAGTWTVANGKTLGLYKSVINGMPKDAITVLEYNDGNLLTADLNSSDTFSLLYNNLSANGKETRKETITLPDGLSFSKDSYQQSQTFYAPANYPVIIPVYSVYHVQSVDKVTIEMRGDDNADLVIGVTPGEGVVKVEVSYTSLPGKTYTENISNIALDWSMVPAGHYDPAEALMALHMASVSITGRTEENLHNLGFSKIVKFTNEWEGHDTTDPKGCAYFLAQKKVPVNGKIKTVIAVLVRGTSGTGEWIGNFLNALGDNRTLNYTFYSAAEIVYDGIKDYIQKNDISPSSAIPFVCGHSRGAATAGLVVHFMNADPVLDWDESKTVGYTTATPNNMFDLSWNGDANIYNYEYAHDLVTYVPQGYLKVGTTYFVGGSSRPNDVADIYEEIYEGDNKNIADNAILIELLIKANRALNHLTGNDGTQGISGQTSGKSLDSLAVNYSYNLLKKLTYKSEAIMTGIGSAHAIENYLAWMRGNGTNGIENAVEYRDDWNLTLDTSSNVFWNMVINSLQDGIETAKSINALHLISKRMNNELVKKCIFTIISCPVDVKIYDQTGTAVASIVDHQIEFVIERDDFFAFTDGEKDYVYFDEGSGYDVIITGNDDGEMEIETQLYDENSVLENSVSLTEPVTNNEQFSLNIVAEDLEQTSVVSDGVVDPGSGTKVIIIDNDLLSRTIDLGTTGTDWEKLSYQLGAVVRPLGSDQNVTWESSDPTVAAVDASGLVTGLKTGTVTITATAQDGSNANASVQLDIVTHIQPENILISEPVPVGVGCSLTLDAVIDQAVKPENQELTWSSDNTDIVSVENDGTVIGIGIGTARITVCAAENEQNCNSFDMEVMDAAEEVQILNGEAVTITGDMVVIHDESYQVNALPSPLSASHYFLWSSSDPDTAAVDAGGGVTFLTPGTVTITAESTDGSGKSASVTLTYEPLPTTCGSNVRYEIADGTITFSPVNIGKDAVWGSDCGAVFREDQTITAVNISSPITVTDAASMFEGSAYVQEMYLSNFDMSQVASLDSMFSGCTALEKLYTGGWDTSGVENMGGMFRGCTSLESADLSGWDTSNVYNSTEMFSGCDILNTLVLGENTLSQNIFSSHPKYNGTWMYIQAGEDADNAIPLNTKYRDASLFENYDSHQMAGTWQVVIPAAVSVAIIDPAGNNITGKTVTVDSVSYQLQAVPEPEDAEQSVTWTSSDAATAEIDDSGLVTFKKAGTVAITATVNDQDGVNSSVNLKLLPEAETITITDSKGTDITGKTITSNTLTYQLAASAAPAEAEQTVTWQSSDTDIAAVSEDGKVTFKKAGTVMITATSTDRGKKTAEMKLKLLPEATAITITNSKGTAITGKTITSNTLTYQLKASAAPANAAQTVTWKSSNTGIAEVGKDGKVTFKKAGTVMITATSTDRGKKAATVKLKLLPEATAIVIKNNAGTAVTGKTVTSKTMKYQLSASATPAGAAQTVTWKSSNTAVATVNAQGLVTFKKAGTVTITAISTDRGKKTAIVNLKLLPKAKKIIIKNPKGTTINGKLITVNTKTYKLKASANPAAAEQTVTWKSSNTNIATVNKAGKVTFKKAGTVVITATSTDRGKKTGKVRLKYAP